MMHDSFYGYKIFGGPEIFLYMFLFMALMALGVVVLVRGLGHAGQEHSDAALDTLRKRYAAGDIDKKEFEEKKKDLA